MCATAASSGGPTVTCGYRVDAALLESLDSHLGPPLDSYVRGWQVWLEDNGPAGETLEWRLHPPARFAMPRGENPHDLFGDILQGLAGIQDPEHETIALGRERLRLDQVWEILEVFPAYGDDIDPGALAHAAAVALGGRMPDVAGHVDHARMGDEWNRRRGDYSVGAILLDLLEPPDGR